jgi:2-amino-4-hydroxy-6-hydroxymethyldihydropteridine diphosphokinase
MVSSEKAKTRDKGRETRDKREETSNKKSSSLVYLGIGSNLGSRRENCLEAIRLLEESPFISVIKGSSFYETEPLGYENQPPFINCVIEIETTLEPQRLLKICQDIEVVLARERVIHWGPRTIDIDILLYNNQVIDQKDLKIPHPLMHERGFVLIPLSEIVPEAIHPVYKKKIKDLLKVMKDKHSVIRV